MNDNIEELVHEVSQSRYELGGSSIEVRNKFLDVLSENLIKSKDIVFSANQRDLENSITSGTSQSLIKRLSLQQEKLDSLLLGLKNLSFLPDPLNKTTFARELDVGLNLYRVTSPIGVLCIIFESRPEAVIQISSLAVKSGNCVVLKGGKEANETNSVLVEIIQQSLADERVKLPKKSIVLIKSRSEIDQLLRMDKYIDLIIPRGSNALVSYIQKNTSIPVMGHADGVCHVFVDESADIEKSLKICVDSKTEYPAVCNACETILVHSKIAQVFLPKLAPMLFEKRTILHCDPRSFSILSGVFPNNVFVKPLYSSVDDISSEKQAMDIFKREYLIFEVSIVTVDNLDKAIRHINTFGSKHTDCILSTNEERINRFFLEVDSAGVYCNCSTRFADGFRYGFGAEVGVSTNKLHARGPVGMEGLLTYKYRLVGDGHIVEPYNKHEKQYTHRDINMS